MCILFFLYPIGYLGIFFAGMLLMNHYDVQGVWFLVSIAVIFLVLLGYSYAGVKLFIEKK